MKASESEKPKILVVDDFAASRMTASVFLSLEGYEVLEADCGETALKLVSEVNFDLILLDVKMPDLDGYEVCRRLKEDEETRLIPIIFITMMNDPRSRLLGIEAGGDDYLSKPFNALELLARVKSLIHQKRLNEDLDHAEQVLVSIARTIESRDPNTGNHCERLAFLGEAFGKFLRLPRGDIRTLSLAGYLHDIGKIGIPDAVLLKTGPLSPSEWQIMQQHVLIGEQICQPLRTMRGVLPIIRYHHERWDGSGYPDGLAGDEIPELVQIFQLLDIYDALTHERSYKRALTLEEALEAIAGEFRQGWRNPRLAAPFSAFIRSFPADTNGDRASRVCNELYQIDRSWSANDIINVPEISNNQKPKAESR